MLNSISCPLCTGKAILTTSPLELTFQGKDHEVTRYFYRCEDCKEEFTDEETDTKTLSQLPGYPEYLEKSKEAWENYKNDKERGNTTDSEGG